MNARRLPSGDHDGYIPLAGSVVRRRSSPPFAGIVWTSRPTWNASVDPSGEKTGNHVEPVRVTRDTGAPGDGDATYASNPPPRSDMKTMLDPSGDQVAETSRDAAVVRRRTPEPSAFIA